MITLFAGANGDEGGESWFASSSLPDGTRKEIFGTFDQFTKSSRDGAQDAY